MTYNATDIYDALRMAQEFLNAGEYNLFRGQARNWKVISSMGRVKVNKRHEAHEKLERFALFFDASASLKKYLESIDWFYAVAQHYGLPTPYIDFTRNPKIAAYFATNSKSNKLKEK